MAKKIVIYKIYSIFLLLTLYSCDHCREYNNTYRSDEYNGRITNKYIDRKYKNVPTIIIKTAEKEDFITPYGRDTTGIWQHVQIGDSIIKKAGTLTYTIISNGRTINYTLNCRNFD